MAIRYSGSVVVRVVWRDREEQWRAHVRWPTGHEIVWVGRAPADRLAVDSPEAYDVAARSAIAFCETGGSDSAIDNAEYSECGVVVRRAKP